MIPTSNLWKTIVANAAHTTEYRVKINGHTYSDSAIADITITRPLMNGLSIGNAACAELYLLLEPVESVPRAARIDVDVRVAVGSQVSEWLSKGHFWIDTRVKRQDGLTEFTAFDAMARADRVWLDMLPETGNEWPMSMTEAVDAICESMDVELDSRVMIENYNVEYPNDLTMREVLGYIAAAHGGNFYITDAGELMLTKLKDTPVVTNYLTDEFGNVLLWGTVRIVV